MRYRFALSGIAALAGLLSGPASASGLIVEGTSFVMARPAPLASLRSPDLIGAEIDLEDGTTLRIDAVRADPDDPDIFLHEFSVRTAAGWQPFCGPGFEGRREGFPLPGRWDENGRFHMDGGHFALTCTGGTQAKCVRFGYKPWATDAAGESLLPLYEACVRATRADYCGDGEGFTETGTLIDIYDDRGVMAPEPDLPLRFEAGWSPAGAVCVNHTRIAKNLDLDDLALRCPRLSGDLGESCTEDEARRRGAVIFIRSR